jgi:hypothetical protein
LRQALFDITFSAFADANIFVSWLGKIPGKQISIADVIHLWYHAEACQMTRQGRFGSLKNEELAVGY